MTDKLYPTNLDPRALEPEFSKHMLAMTAERLESKADIALQLAWRDRRIAKLWELATRIRGLEAGCQHRFDSDGDCMYCEMKDPRR